MQTFCRAQARINEIDRSADAERKASAERVRTCRSLLLDELTQQKVRCVEVAAPGGEVAFVRLKESTPQRAVPLDEILSALSRVSGDALRPHAALHGNDVPRMLAAIVKKDLRATTSVAQSPPKDVLVVSRHKARGYDGSVSAPASTRQMASALLDAMAEAKRFRGAVRDRKTPSVEEQKAVEESVKIALRTMDPATCTSRIHMIQSGVETVYYLRLREKRSTKRPGIRAVVPLIESAAASTLDAGGLPRDTGVGVVDRWGVFWDPFVDRIREEYAALEKKEHVASRITLDRGPPRTSGAASR